jgi:hypothetical protein
MEVLFCSYISPVLVFGIHNSTNFRKSSASQSIRAPKASTKHFPTHTQLSQRRQAYKMPSISRTTRVTLKVTHPDGSVERYEKSSEDDRNGTISPQHVIIFGRGAGSIRVHTTSSANNSTDERSESSSERSLIDD